MYSSATTSVTGRKVFHNGYFHFNRQDDPNVIPRWSDLCNHRLHCPGFSVFFPFISIFRLWKPLWSHFPGLTDLSSRLQLRLIKNRLMPIIWIQNSPPRVRIETKFSLALLQFTNQNFAALQILLHVNKGLWHKTHAHSHWAQTILLLRKKSSFAMFFSSISSVRKA